MTNRDVDVGVDSVLERNYNGHHQQGAGQRRNELEIYCSICEQSISYEGVLPRFCHQCGNTLAAAHAAPHSTSDATPGPPTDGERQMGPKSRPRPDIDTTLAPSPKIAVPLHPTGKEEIIGPYRLVRWLGSGGMGTVWEAVETHTGRRVALKRLSMNMVSDETYVKRFEREAQLAAQISHPNVTFIFGSGSENGQPYIAMELMPGKTLDDRVKQEGQLTIPQAVDSILDVVEGLIAAHQAGMIHRDVKPANCFISADGSVKIGDFGLSKSLLSHDVNLTQTGTFMGTPSFAAPEQIRAGELDGRTDVYAIGATLYFLLTGRTPFKGDSMSVTAQIITDKPASTRRFNNNIPKDLDGLIAKCLEKDPGHRFQDLERLKVALLPYASKQESIADLGRRLAAFMIDLSMIQILFNIAAVAWIIGATYYLQDSQEIDSWKKLFAAIQKQFASVMLWKFVLGWSTVVLYFAIVEGRFGRGLGKRLMGLKVVNREGQRAGFWRGLVRAVAVPGCFAIPLILIIGYSHQGEMPLGSADYFIFMMYQTLAYGIPLLVFVSTMRVSNQLLGLHGMISGTRVIRIETGRQKIHIPMVQPKLRTVEPVSLGPYTTRDLIGTSERTRIFLGHDELLNRDLWIVEWESCSKPGDQRIHLARVTRQRWLDGGELDNGKRWDAFEAILGIPIQTFLDTKNLADWGLFGHIMIEIIDELHHAIEDGTLPVALSLPQVWLDKDGHAKLIDKRLVPQMSENCPTEFPANKPVPELDSDPIEKATVLIQELGELFLRTQILPSSVQDFLFELNQRPPTITTFEWANRKLTTLAKPIGSIQWDSRLGILSASFGIEFIVYALIASCMFLSCYYVVPIPNTIQYVVGTFAGLVLPVALGFWFHGGPVFQLMGVQVCDSKGRSASRVKCAIRSGLSWFPVIALLGAFILATLFAFHGFGDMEPELGSMSYDLHYNRFFMVSLQLLALFSGISLGVGLVFSVLNPKQGLVDLLLQTRLMPK